MGRVECNDPRSGVEFSGTYMSHNAVDTGIQRHALNAKKQGHPNGSNRAREYLRFGVRRNQNGRGTKETKREK